jgi:hypothetical protein
MMLTYRDGENERGWLANENSEMRSQLLAIVQWWDDLQQSGVLVHASWCSWHKNSKIDECTCTVSRYQMRFDDIIGR